MKPKEVVAALMQAAPEFKDKARVGIPSSSAGIYLAGQAPEDPDPKACGWHIYYACSNPADIPRAMAAVVGRLMLNGHLAVLVSERGGLLPRTIIDASVWQPSRIDYVAPAVIDETLERKTPKGGMAPGGVVNLANIPNLTLDEQERLDRLIAVAKTRPDVLELAQKRRAEYLERQTPKVQARNPSLTPEGARAVVARTFDVGHIIPLEWPVELDDGTTLTVRDIWDKGTELDGATCRDPFEPDYDGGRRGVAMVMLSGESAHIKSFAHGGQRYFLQRPEWQLSNNPFKETVYRKAAADMAARPGDATEILDAASTSLTGLGVPTGKQELKGTVKRAMKVLNDESQLAGRAVADKRDAAQQEDGDWIDEFNQRYTVIETGGKIRVVYLDQDRGLDRGVWKELDTDAFAKVNMQDRVPTASGGNALKPKTEVWLSHPRRKPDCVEIFDPSQPPGTTVAGILNRWTGFNVTGNAANGSPDLMIQHIHEVICCNDPVKIAYIDNWIAFLFQHPEEKHEVVVVVQGGQGAGKTIVGELIAYLCGQSGAVLDKPGDLIGQFNSHLQGLVFAFADEAFFHGDKSAVDALKGIITGQVSVSQGKFKDAVQKRNRLSLWIASNHEQVIDAQADARRFVVVEASQHRTGDKDYFEGLGAWRRNPDNLAAFFEYYRGLDIAGWHPRQTIETVELQKQRQFSLDLRQQWWVDVLARGSLGALNGHWFEQVTPDALFDSFQLWQSRMKANSRFERHTQMSLSGWAGKNLDRNKTREIRVPQALKHGPVLLRVVRAEHSGQYAYIKAEADHAARERVLTLGSLAEARDHAIREWKLPCGAFDACVSDVGAGRPYPAAEDVF